MFRKSAIILTASIIPLLGFAARPSVLEIDKSLENGKLIMPSSAEISSQKMMENWYLKNYATVDSLADYRENVKASDEEIVKRLSKIPAEIELPFNSLVKNSIAFYTERKRSLVSNMVGLSYYYFPIFEQALDRHGLPMELKCLAIIESALDPNAKSPVGACGLWQFMTATAKGLDLEVNTLVDERRDPIKSSEKAALYLKELYSIYHDWHLAIAAYNCGLGNVNKAIRRLPANVKADFWAIYPYLPQETRSYVPAFIAACYVMNYYDSHNIVPALIKRPLVTDTVTVTKRVNLQQIADVLQIPIDEIRLLNPQYRKDVIPGNIHPYKLILPSQQIAAYIISEDSIIAHDAEKYARRDRVQPSDGTYVSVSDDGEYIVTEKTLYHKVKKKETLTSIAKRYGVTVASIREANGGIRKAKLNSLIKIKVVKRERRPKSEYDMRTDSLAIPDNGENAQNTDSITSVESNESKVDTVVSPAPEKKVEQKKVEQKKEKVKKNKKHDSQGPVYVKVRKGDNLSKIAQRNGTTVAKIKKLNNMKNDRINAGQKIRVK